MSTFRAITTFAVAGTIATLLGACSSDNDIPPFVQQALLDRYTLSSMDSVPEGVAFDGQTRAFFATALEGASITRIEADGTESDFRPADGRASLLGAKVDEERRRLWVCARDVDATDNRVWVYDVDTGDMTMEFLLGALATNGSCNDLALDSAGNAYVTDSGNPNIYKLDGSTGEGSVFASDPLLDDVTGLGLGLNGIEVLPDDAGVIAARLAPAALFHVSLPGGDSITPVALDGDALPPPDGIIFLDGDLYTVSDRAVSRVRPNAGFTAGEVTSVEQVSGLSTATVAEGTLYVIKSEVTRSVLGQPLELPFEIFSVDLGPFD